MGINLRRELVRCFSLDASLQGSENSMGLEQHPVKICELTFKSQIKRAAINCAVWQKPAGNC